MLSAVLHDPPPGGVPVALRARRWPVQFGLTLPPANPVLGVELVQPFGRHEAHEHPGALRLVDLLGVAAAGHGPRVAKRLDSYLDRRSDST